jgi:hypothetical protein
MSLTGDLRTMPLPDVLQWVAAGRKSGTLHVARGSVQKRVMLRGGSIQSTWSNDPRESLGQFLIRARLITEQQLFTALLAQEEKGLLLGSLLVEQGLISENELRAVLEAKAEETLYELFLWPAGQFEFHEGELAEQVGITLDAPVTPVILEGVRRLDEWLRIKDVFPSMATTLRPGTPLPDNAPELEREILRFVESGRNLAEISLELRRSDFDTAARAFDLHARGHVVVDVAVPASAPADPVAAIQALLAHACRRVNEGRLQAARDAYEDVLSLDRLNQHAKKGLAALAAGREQPPRLDVPRDRVPVVAVDFATLTRQNLDPLEGFVLSRVNGEWDVQSILKLCPIPEEEALAIFSRLIERGLIGFS